MAARITGIQNEIDPRNLENPTLAFLKAYWDEKRGTRAMPTRADIKPSDMKEHLGWIILLDAHCPDYTIFASHYRNIRVTQYFMRSRREKP